MEHAHEWLPYCLVTLHEAEQQLGLQPKAILDAAETASVY